MSRLKPLQKDEDIKSIPVSESVLVELPPMGDAADPVPEKKSDSKPEISDDAQRMTKQLEELQAARDAERQARERAERDATEARRLASQRQAENDTLRQERHQDERALVNNGLATAQSERDAAKVEWKAAYDAGDADALAAAQSKISRAEARIVHFENAVAAQDAEDERRKSASKPEQREAAPVDVAAHIDRMPNLLPQERDWLKAHPEVMMDNSRNQELSVAYNRAMRRNLVRGTPEYFAYLDDFLGYKSARRDDDAGDENDRSSAVAAPVSRDTTSSTTGRKSDGGFRMELTPEMRSMIKSMGISETQYVQQAKRLHDDKRSNPEKYAGGGR